MRDRIKRWGPAISTLGAIGLAAVITPVWGWAIILACGIWSCYSYWPTLNRWLGWLAGAESRKHHADTRQYLQFKVGTDGSYQYPMPGGSSLLRFSVTNVSGQSLREISVSIVSIDPNPGNLALPLQLHRMHANDLRTFSAPFDLHPEEEVFIDLAYLALDPDSNDDLVIHLAHAVVGVAIPPIPADRHSVVLRARGRDGILGEFRGHIELQEQAQLALVPDRVGGQ